MSEGVIERTIKSLPSQIPVACLHLNVLCTAQDDAVYRSSISAPRTQVAYIMEINIDSHEAFDQCTCYPVYTHWVVHDRNAAINIRYFHTLVTAPNWMTIDGSNLTKIYEDFNPSEAFNATRKGFKHNLRVTNTVLCIFVILTLCGVGWVARYSDSLRAGRSGDQIPVGRDFFPFRLALGAPPSLL